MRRMTAMGGPEAAWMQTSPESGLHIDAISVAEVVELAGTGALENFRARFVRAFLVAT
jgi:hypothetical protein